jgi:ABC-type sugar transport system permease subunit
MIADVMVLRIRPPSFFLVYLVYPSIDTFRRSLMDARSDKFVGFDNYQFIITTPQFVSNTLSPGPISSG